MHAAVLYHLDGEPDGDATVESRLDPSGDLPAVDAERTEYLDDRVCWHGQAAGRVSTESEVPLVHDDGIATERVEQTDQIVVDFYADPGDGWIGVSSSDGEFVADLVASSNGLLAEDMSVDLNSWVDHLRQQDAATVEGYNYSVDGGGDDEDDGHDRAGAAFGADASMGGLREKGNRLVLFRYMWNGTHCYGVLAASGYAAVYSDWTAPVFARWLADEVLPYAVQEDGDATVQLQLGETSTASGGVAGE